MAPSGLWTGPYLAGDWNGGRSSLADRGVALDLRYTSSYQGLVSGTGDEEFEYGGKLDAFVNLDSGKLGLWEGGGLRTHIEYKHGDAPPNLGGTLFAVNTAQFYPVRAPEELEATSLYFTQRVGNRVNVLVGKINPIDLFATDPFFYGWGIDRFMSLIFAGPPSGLVPPVAMGAIAVIRSEPIAWTLTAFDPNDRTRDYWPRDLFEDGVNLSVTGAHATTLAGRETSYAVTAYYSTAEGVDLSQLPPDITTSTKKGSYNVAFQFTHDLRESAERPGSDWGLYIKAAIADGNPNYVKSSLIAGISGKALFPRRPRDTFGFGAFYYDLSDELQDTTAPSANFQDEAGFEVYYNCAVTPWLYVGANIQYVDPARGDNDKALVAAPRTQIRF